MDRRSGGSWGGEGRWVAFVYTMQYTYEGTTPNPDPKKRSKHNFQVPSVCGRVQGNSHRPLEVPWILPGSSCRQCSAGISLRAGEPSGPEAAGHWASLEFRIGATREKEDTAMKFVTIRELRSKTASIRKDLAQEREIVLTANGRPFAVVTPVEPDSVEEELQAIRRARAKVAVERLRTQARAKGLDRLTMGEIDAIVAETRRARRGSR